MLAAAGAVAAVLAALAALFAGARKLLNRDRRYVAEAVIRDPEEHTVTDPDTGAVTSIQGADLTMPSEELERFWTPHSLERLAATYWRFLSRVTLGVVRVRYTEEGRQVCLFGIKALPMLTFRVPEYEMDADRGIVRWRIDRGLLVGRRGRGGDGYLEIDVERCEADAPGRAKLHVEVEVANFYPSLAGIAQWFYANTQSRIHVIVTHGFLRSLARLDLAESKVGRFPAIEDVPDPTGTSRLGSSRR